MIHTVCAYFDKDTNKFNPPFVVPFNLDDTIESVKDGAIKGKIEGAKSFDLFHLGSYDTANAKFKLNREPVKVLELAKYVRD